MALIKYSSKEILDMFYEEIKDKYPKLTKRQIIDVCYSPFRYLRIAITKKNLPTIRMKNLGKFQPNTFQIIKFYAKLDELYLNNIITRERYEYLKEIFTDHLKRKIQKIKDDYKNNVERGLTYKVDEREHNFIIDYLTPYLKYETLVPIKEDDLKTNLQKYQSLPARNDKILSVVQDDTDKKAEAMLEELDD